MASYFDHFMVIKVLSSYVTDSFFIMIIVIVAYMIMCKHYFVVPTSVQNAMEIMIEHWTQVVSENLGEKFGYYLLPLSMLFMFLLGMNLFGFFMYTFTPMTHISLTFGIALSLWLGVVLFGFKNFSLNFFSMFMPAGAPLFLSPLLVMMEMVSSVSSPVALGMRLAANLTAGHILLSMLADFGCKLVFYSWSLFNLFPIFIMIFMTMLEVSVLVMQAYVFSLLVMIYLKDSMMLH